jgi:hypothetical protein
VKDDPSCPRTVQFPRDEIYSLIGSVGRGALGSNRMRRVCPQCKASYTQYFLCPKCGVQLLDSAALAPQPAAEGPLVRVPSFWGRLFIGLVLAQGLFYGLRQVVNAYLLAVGDDPVAFEQRFAGLVTLQALQGVALLIGGLFAGAGQPRGSVAGAVLGIWNAALILVAQTAFRYHLDDLTLYGLPIFHAFLGALGGGVGSMIWKPLPHLPGFVPATDAGLKVTAPTERSVPFAWGRILTGVAIAVGGTVWAHTIRNFVSDASRGALHTDSLLQAQFITWEISTMAVLVGAALAGCTTANGTKQGAAVGLLAGAGIIAVHVALGRNQYPAQEFLLEQLGAGRILGKMTAQLAALLLVNSFLLSLLGGWFGGQLMPPAGQPKQRLRAPD